MGLSFCRRFVLLMNDLTSWNNYNSWYNYGYSNHVLSFTYQRRCLKAHVISLMNIKWYYLTNIRNRLTVVIKNEYINENKNYKILLSGQYFYCWVLFYVQTSNKKPFIPFSFVIFPTKLYYVSIKQMNWINKISSMFWNYDCRQVILAV